MQSNAMIAPANSESRARGQDDRRSVSMPVIVCRADHELGAAHRLGGQRHHRLDYHGQEQTGGDVSRVRSVHCDA